MGKAPLYLHIPKTGGTFMTSYLQEAYGSEISIWGHRNICDLSDKRKYFKFAVVRNPFDWYVSRYFYFSRKQILEGGVSIECDSGLNGQYFKNKFPTFRDHLYWGVENKISGFWFTDRIKSMCHTNGRDSINHYFKLESLHEIIDVISSKCGIDARISISDYESKLRDRADKRLINHNHYSQYYDEDMIKLVEDMDGDIIKRFGYSFERK